MFLAKLLPVIIVGVLLYMLMTYIRTKKKHVMCPTCGLVVNFSRENKGSSGVEIVLYLLGILPGFLYSLTRLVPYKNRCPQCGYDLGN